MPACATHGEKISVPSLSPYSSNEICDSLQQELLREQETSDIRVSDLTDKFPTDTFTDLYEGMKFGAKLMDIMKTCKQRVAIIVKRENNTAQFQTFVGFYLNTLYDSSDRIHINSHLFGVVMIFQDNCLVLETYYSMDTVVRALHTTILNAPCSICLEPLMDNKSTVLFCGHILHSVCFEVLLKSPRATCPMCRDPIKYLQFENGICSVHTQVIL